MQKNVESNDDSADAIASKIEPIPKSGPKPNMKLAALAGWIAGLALVVAALNSLYGRLGDTWDALYPAALVKDIKISYLPNSQLKEGGTYVIVDDGYKFKIYVRDVIAKTNVAIVALYTGEKPEVLVQVPLREEKYFVVGDREYAVRVEDMADVAKGTDWVRVSMSSK